MASFYDPLRAGVVCISGSTKHAVGTGFVISLEASGALIATCTHVIELANPKVLTNPQEEKVFVEFDIAPSEGKWEALVQRWSPADEQDVTILKIERELPSRIRALPLCQSLKPEGRRVRVFGYPETGRYKGSWGHSESCIPGPRDEKTGQVLLQFDSNSVTKGYSGAPVWDIGWRKVIGMVVQITRQDSFGRRSGNVFALPAEVLHEMVTDIPIAISSPYHGDEPFNEGDADVFIGDRKSLDKLTQVLHDCYNKDRFLTILGSPGCGKTSIVQAYLLPQLRRGAIHGRQDFGILKVRVSNTPFEQLEAYGLVGASTNLANSLHLWCREQGCAQPVLILDQFEELLLDCSQEVQHRFVEELIHVATQNVALVILILKDTFYHLLAKHEALIRLVEDSIVNVVVPPEEMWVDIAQNRAKEREITLHPRLIQKIIERVKDTLEQNRNQQVSPIALYERVLTTVWKQWNDQSHLSEGDIELDSVLADINTWVERLFLSLDERQQMIAKRVCVQLVRLGDETGGVPDTRLMIPLVALCHDGREQDDLYMLTEQGLFIIDRDMQTNEEIITLANEELLYNWQRLRQWLDEERQFILWYQTFQIREHTWAVSNQDHEEQQNEQQLLYGFVLTEAEHWLHQYPWRFIPREHEYVRISRVQQDCQEHRQKDHEKQKIELQKQRQILQARQLAVRAKLAYEQHPMLLNRSMLLAMESMRQFPTLEAEQVLRYGLNLFPRPRMAMKAKDVVQVVAFSAYGRYAAVANTGCTIDVFELTTGQMLYSFPPVPSPIVALAFHPEEKYLAVASTNGSIQIWYLAQQSVITLSRGTPVTAIIFSPGGRYLVTIHWDEERGIAELWEVSSWRYLYPLVHGAHIQAFAFSPDECYFATGCSDSRTYIWQVARKAVYRHFQHKAHVRAVAFSPGGYYVAMASDDGAFAIWEVEKGVFLFHGQHTQQIRCITFSPGGNYLVTTSNDGTARVWMVPSGEARACLPHGDTVWAASFSINNRYLATASDDQVVRIWDIDTSQEIFRMVHETPVQSLAFSMEQRYVFTASQQAIQIWELTKSRQRLYLTGPFDQPTNMVACASNDGVLCVAAGSEDGYLYLWKFISPDHSNITSWALESNVRVVAWSSNNYYLAAGADSGAVSVWDVVSGKQKMVGSQKGSIYALTFSPDGLYLATASADTKVRVWCLEDGESRCLPHDGAVNAVAFSHDGHVLATACIDGKVQVWKWQEEQVIAQLHPQHMASVNAISYNMESQILLSASDDGYVRVWEWQVSSVQQSFDLPHNGPVNMVVCSQDGQFIATASEDGTACIWNARTGLRHVQLPHREEVWAVAFSPDSCYLATASGDGSARIWETTTGMQCVDLVHLGSVRSLAFSPDGHYLATASSDGTTNLWLWRTEDILKEVHERLTDARFS